MIPWPEQIAIQCDRLIQAGSPEVLILLDPGETEPAWLPQGRLLYAHGNGARLLAYDAHRLRDAVLRVLEH